jgi:hypothetical protein
VRDAREKDRSDRAIITPAPHRTLILVKVPCSIVLVSGEIAQRTAKREPSRSQDHREKSDWTHAALVAAQTFN